jgi:hypothetical protein
MKGGIRRPDFCHQTVTLRSHGCTMAIELFAELLARLKDESIPARRIVEVDSGDLGLLSGDIRAPKQHPFAAVLGCSDARVPVELVFTQGPNDLFVIRVAGNGLGPDVFGSLKYAMENLGGSLKLIVVLGHSGCGTLSAAVDVFLNPGDFLPLAAKHSLRGILDRLLVVVHTSARKLQQAFGSDVVHHQGYREALIEASIVTNSAFSATGDDCQALPWGMPCIAIPCLTTQVIITASLGVLGQFLVRGPDCRVTTSRSARRHARDHGIAARSAPAADAAPCWRDGPRCGDAPRREGAEGRVHERGSAEGERRGAGVSGCQRWRRPFAISVTFSVAIFSSASFRPFTL